MNITNQKKTNKFINYWTKDGENSRKSNLDCKIQITTEFTKNGKTYSSTTYRNTTAKDITFNKRKISKLDAEVLKKMKQERFESLPYSKLHNKLISNTYGTVSRIEKQQREKLIHEERIEKLTLQQRLRTKLTGKRSSNDYPHFVVIRNENSKGEPYDYYTIPSAKPLKELMVDTKEMSKEYSSNPNYKDFFNIEVWEREPYLNRLNKKGSLERPRFIAWGGKDEKKAA